MYENITMKPLCTINIYRERQKQRDRGREREKDRTNSEEKNPSVAP
jgi:hypothetical protein